MFKGFKIIIKMGFKSETQSGRRGYRFNNLIFPSKQIYLTVKKINSKLDLLYSPAPQGSLWPTIRYSSSRDDFEEFNDILDKVEKYFDRFNEEYDEVTILETDNAAFNQEFLGIVNFLYEAFDFYCKEDELSKKTPEYIKERFIFIADKLWYSGICPGEF